MIFRNALYLTLHLHFVWVVRVEVLVVKLIAVRFLMRWKLVLLVDLPETVLTAVLIRVNSWFLECTALLLALLGVELLYLVLI